MSKQTTERPERDDAHLRDIDDGCGCVEVWEHMSDDREERDEDTADP